MQQLYQNSMAIVHHFRKPTLFITFTANPNWVEIQQELQGCKVEDQPDIVVRVFNQKRRALLKDIETAFGHHLGTVWTLEWQKRGLPHIHILLFLAREDNLMERACIDEFVCAELPDPAMDPTGELADIVKNQLTHGPCGEHNPNAPCMIPDPNGAGRICSKHFLKSFNSETVVTEDGYPLYRRRNDGRTWIKKVNGRNVTMNNQWVVPYSPYLTKIYNVHINVEVCVSVKAIKYIHKYIYKGNEHMTAELQNSVDEVARHLNRRYISPQIAVWHMLEFPTHAV